MERTLRIERRESEREEAKGSVLAAVTIPGGGTKIARVELRDISFGGLGLRSEIELQAGSSVALYPPEGRHPTYSGTVVRCSDADNGYRVGVRSVARRAA